MIFLLALRGKNRPDVGSGSRSPRFQFLSGRDQSKDGSCDYRVGGQITSREAMRAFFLHTVTHKPEGATGGFSHLSP